MKPARPVRRAAVMALVALLGLAYHLASGVPRSGARRLHDDHPSNDMLLTVASGHLSTDCSVGSFCLRSGGLLVPYLLGAAYCFVALAIVCDEFFVPSLSAFADYLGLSMDVAGATFMAAGGSTPELFTSFIGTFQRSDIGFATIVGSAVFNVLFVIGICAVAADKPLQLSPWPLGRDCSYYIIALLTVALFFVGSSPGVIECWEASLLLAEYVGYCLLMKFNGRLQRLFLHVPDELPEVAVAEPGDCSVRSGRSNRHFRQPSTFRTGVVDLLKQNASAVDALGIAAVTMVAGNLRETFEKLDEDKSGFIEDWELGQLLRTLGCSDGGHVAKLAMSISQSCDGKIGFEDFKKWYLVSEARIEIEARRVFESFDRDGDGTVSQEEICRILQGLGHQPGEEEAAMAIEEVLRAHAAAEPPPTSPAGSPMRAEGITFQQFRHWYVQSLFWQEKKQQRLPDDGGAAVETHFSIELPSDASWSGICWYILTYPICAALYITMPDVRRPNRDGAIGFAILQFSLALLWIGLLSLCLVEWVEVSSNTLGIPSAIAGVTVLAAGTSVPDLLTSYIVARNGEGDMAVSSSIGSNIFDILVGLALPWLCFCLARGESVRVETTSLGLSILVLVLMLLAVLAAVVCMGWKMTRRLGGVMFVLYGVFVVQSVLQKYPRGHPVIRVF